MITGEENPDSGTIKIGETVKLAYADQRRSWTRRRPSMRRYRRGRISWNWAGAR